MVVSFLGVQRGETLRCAVGEMLEAERESGQKLLYAHHAGPVSLFTDPHSGEPDSSASARCQRGGKAAAPALRVVMQPRFSGLPVFG
jgi:hypothetical protein